MKDYFLNEFSKAKKFIFLVYKQRNFGLIARKSEERVLILDAAGSRRSNGIIGSLSLPSPLSLALFSSGLIQVQTSFHHVVANITMDNSTLPLY